MEPHAIPQNVTSFEFKLVGDMTLKQFGYLSAGAGIAYLTFVFIASPLPILAWPIIFFSSLSGIAFAFLPLGDRPLDHWVKAFIKAVYSPTKRVWKKNSQDYQKSSLFLRRLDIYLQSLNPTSPMSQPTLIQTGPVQTSPNPSPLPSEEELEKTVELAKEAQALQTQIIENQKQLNQLKVEATSTAVNPQSISPQITTVFSNIQKLTQEASEIKQELAQVTNEPEKPSEPVKVQVIIPTKTKPTQLTLTSLPNVINGIVTDSERNFLEGAVVVISDKNGLPVRAIKTNKLGQFTGATPLPNGVYTVEMEKDSLVFDVLQIELVGSILPPLQIAAKKVVGTT